MSLASRPFSLCMSLTAAAALSLAAHAAPGPAAPTADRPAPELFLAIGQRDMAAVKTLLSSGVSANARNTLGMSALQIAAGTGNLEMVKTLLAAGAQVNAPSPFGSPLSFAASDSKPEVIQFLLTRGAHVTDSRPDRITILMLAARAGNPAVVQQLLKKGASLAAIDNHGSTALSYAARAGKTAAARVLLEAGAAVDAPDVDGWTPLMHAAVNGHAETAALLLNKGASPKKADSQGRTALLLAAGYGDHPEATRLLLEHGAAQEARDKKGRTAYALASARGYTATAKLLQDRGARTGIAVSTPERTPRQAAQASLRLVEQSMQTFAKRTGCISCHHEGLARVATGFAQTRGYTTDPEFARKQDARILDNFGKLQPLLEAAAKDPAAIKNIPVVDVGDFAPTVGTLLLGLAEHRAPATKSLTNAALVLGRTQTPDGDWRFGMVREPVQSSFFTMTSMAVRALQTYASAQHPDEVRERVTRAKRWLGSAPASNTEDRVFRLLGLKWAGATAEERRQALEELRTSQRPDGGWSQVSSLQSDAYATGSALYALHQGGDLPASDPAYQRGVKFLLRTQEDDGSWYVYKRAIPGNNYFHAQFPYGQSQYVSHVAASWATVALMLAADEPTGRPVANRQAGAD